MKAVPNTDRNPNLPHDGFSQFNTAAVTIAEIELFDALNRFDGRKLSKRLNEKPELFFPLINAFCNFSRLKLAREKFEWQKKQAEARQRAREDKQRARWPIVITVQTVLSVRTLLTPASTEADAVAQTATQTSDDQPSLSLHNAETAGEDSTTVTRPLLSALPTLRPEEIKPRRRTSTLLPSHKCRHIPKVPIPSETAEIAPLTGALAGETLA
jgi:hypothetical protein